MKAVVLALAASVNESVVGQLWRQVGAALEVVIPIALFITIVVAGGAIVLGLAR